MYVSPSSPATDQANPPNRASLNKLAIRGFRSFDDKHVAVIEFYSPLTVIVGPNGSGKTTIIECLKYATTGDMPPNTKGGAFVHDPKMAGEKEVKAQVRLRFWNGKRERMTATRNLQVTTKKTGGLTMKTLEGLLAKTDANGSDSKRNVISTKCSDMDEEIPYLLGVSKSILENVIFCHQEESNWPLSEPAALKKKFDDIFEATKYTKALDNIKLLRKERAQELKVDKEREKFLKQDKEKAERMRKELAEATAAESRKQTELAELEALASQLQTRNATFFNEASTFRIIYEKSASLQQQKAMYEDNRKHTLKTMNLLTESTEELQHMLNNFDKHLRDIAAQRSNKEDEKEKEENTLDSLRSQERNLASRHGGLLANRRVYEKNLKDREAAIRKVAKEHDIVGYDASPLEDHKVAEFVDLVEGMVRQAENDLRNLREENLRKERELQEELDRLSTMKAASGATKRSKQDQIGKLTDRIRHSEATFDSITNPSVELELVQSKLTGLEADRTKLADEIAVARYDEQIQSRLSAIRVKETQRDDINSELSMLNRKADSRAKLDLQRREMEGKNVTVKKQLEAHSAKFKELIGSDIDPDTMEDKISLAINKRDRKLTEAEAAASAAGREHSTLQGSINIAKESMEKNKAEAKSMERKIRDALQKSGLESTTIEDAMTEANVEIEAAQHDHAESLSSGGFWKQIRALAVQKHKCVACDRHIPDKDLTAILSHIDKSAASTGMEDPEEIEAQIDKWRSVQDDLAKVLPLEGQSGQLREKAIPELEKNIARDEKKLEELKLASEDAKAKVQKAKIACRDLQNLKGAAALISRTLTEIKDLELAVSRLRSELESSGSGKTVEEVQAAADAVTQEIKKLSKEQHQLSSERDFKNVSLSNIEKEINAKTLQIGRLQSQEERRRMEEEALSEMQENLVGLQAELKDLDAQAAAAEAPWREKNESLERFRREKKAGEDDLGKEVAVNRASMGEIEGKHKACQSYITEGNDRKIRESETAMANIKREISAASDARQTLEAVIANLSSELSKAESVKGNIHANIKYRDDGEKIEQVDEELSTLDLVSARESRRRFNAEYAGMQDEEKEASSKAASMRGQLVAMTESRMKLDKTLKMDYKNIDKEFKDQTIKTTLSERANNDLDKYGKALDNAILKYHSIKMDEINDSIGHLWSKTYQGTDIDNIRIVSDHDENSTAARKSYNYRVVMVKNDVELDMRGRCSAGQKVLASIIIRLALAESFAQGCGVLALDEPTTNLDQENIDALATSLAEIIRSRGKQANFQLIVITHDEGFLMRLAAHDVLEHYWRVSRDKSQKSIVERQRVTRQP
ncbi:hypothetical protein IAT38_006507 [Cryptococcus sp. DSM 104549]